jgi:hypothetical protein
MVNIDGSPWFFFTYEVAGQKFLVQGVKMFGRVSGFRSSRVDHTLTDFLTDD